MYSSILIVLAGHDEAGDAQGVAVLAGLVRAKTMTWVTTCMPVVHIFSPLMRQPGLPSFSCGNAPWSP